MTDRDGRCEVEVGWRDRTQAELHQGMRPSDVGLERREAEIEVDAPRDLLQSLAETCRGHGKDLGTHVQDQGHITGDSVEESGACAERGCSEIRGERYKLDLSCRRKREASLLERDPNSRRSVGVVSCASRAKDSLDTGHRQEPVQDVGSQGASCSGENDLVEEVRQARHPHG